MEGLPNGGDQPPPAQNDDRFRLNFELKLILMFVLSISTIADISVTVKCALLVFGTVTVIFLPLYPLIDWIFPDVDANLPENVVFKFMMPVVLILCISRAEGYISLPVQLALGVCGVVALILLYPGIDWLLGDQNVHLPNVDQQPQGVAQNAQNGHHHAQLPDVDQQPQGVDQNAQNGHHHAQLPNVDQQPPGVDQNAQNDERFVINLTLKILLLMLLIWSFIFTIAADIPVTLKYALLVLGTVTVIFLPLHPLTDWIFPLGDANNMQKICKFLLLEVLVMFICGTEGISLPLQLALCVLGVIIIHYLPVILGYMDHLGMLVAPNDWNDPNRNAQIAHHLAQVPNFFWWMVIYPYIDWLPRENAQNGQHDAQLPNVDQQPQGVAQNAQNGHHHAQLPNGGDQPPPAHNDHRLFLNLLLKYILQMLLILSNFTIAADIPVTVKYALLAFGTVTVIFLPLYPLIDWIFPDVDADVMQKLCKFLMLVALIVLIWLTVGISLPVQLALGIFGVVVIHHFPVILRFKRHMDLLADQYDQNAQNGHHHAQVPNIDQQPQGVAQNGVADVEIRPLRDEMREFLYAASKAFMLLLLVSVTERPRKDGMLPGIYYYIVLAFGGAAVILLPLYPLIDWVINAVAGEHGEELHED